MLKGAKRCLAALGRANHQAALQQIGLIDILERSRVLAHRAGKRCQAHGTSGERLSECLQNANIHPVQTKLIDLEELERLTANIKLNGTVAAHLCVIAHALEQAVGKTWRAARTRADLERTGVVDRHAQDGRRARHNLRELLDRVVIQAI